MSTTDTPASREANESTPLLQSDRPLGHQYAGADSAVDSAPNTEEVPEETLGLDLARVQSIPHGGEVEPGFPPVKPQISANDGPRNPTEPKEAQSDHFIDVSPSEFWTIFGGILFSYLIAFFDSTLMGSIHPVVTSHFNAANSASWLSTGFLLTCTAFQPLFGRISDTFGRRPVYLFSIFVFFITTAWCAVAQSIGSFIAARAACGLGAGAVTSLGMIVTSDLVHVEYRGIYQSYINLIYGIGGSLGLVSGGFIADSLGWRAAFGIQLPFIFVYLIIAYFTTPMRLGPELAFTEGWTLRQAIKTLDIKGSFLLVIGVTALMLGINLGGNVLSWDHPLVISSLVAFVIISVLFVGVEAKAKRPVMPLELLSSAPRANLIISNFFATITINTVLFNSPLFFQAVKLESPTQSGLRLVASSIGLMVTSISSGLFLTYTRRLKPAIVIGGLFFIIGGITTGNFSRNLPGWLGMVFLTPSSCGQGFAFPAVTISALAISEQSEQAVIITTLSLFRNLGSVLGVALSSWILQNSLYIYLKESVTGENSVDIINKVRQSVTIIRELDPFHRDQVIYAYEKALRLTFLSTLIWSSIAFLLIVPINLPRLGRKK